MVELPYGRRPLRLVARGRLAGGRARIGAAAHRAGRRDRGRLASRSSGAGARPRPDLVARPPARVAPARRVALGRQAVARSVAQAGTRGVQSRTSSASSRHDRHGHAQRRVRAHDHRPELPARPAPPRECGAAARGRQGNQRRACAEGPRRARGGDRACGRPGRAQDRRAPHRRGDPQRLRPDRGRVPDDDRRRRSHELELHRDQRVGARGEARGARALRRQAPLPFAGREPCRLRRLAAA